MTADAFAVSTDGGQTWNAGIDSQGNAVVSVLNAIGINADWINAGSMLIGGAYRNQDGTITVCDASNNTIFKISKNGIIIETENLTKKYGNQSSVSNLNIHVRQGRIYGLLGRNGAGKTTTMKMLLGLTTPTSGKIKIFGKRKRNLASHRKFD